MIWETQTMRFFKIFTGLILLAIFTMFATANTHTVALYGLFKGQSLIGYQAQPAEQNQEQTTSSSPKEITVFLLVYGSFILGFAGAWILNIGVTRHYKKQIKTMKRKINDQDKELTNLRNLPVSDSSHTDDASQAPLPMNS